MGTLPQIWRRVSRSSLMGSHFMPTTNTRSGIGELRGIDSAAKLTSDNTSGIFLSLNQVRKFENDSSIVADINRGRLGCPESTLLSNVQY